MSTTQNNAPEPSGADEAEGRELITLPCGHRWHAEDIDGGDSCPNCDEV